MQKQNDEHEQLRERLRDLAHRFNQAEISRRTGASKANVHRYLKSGRIPADFLQNVAREFALNPAWLLLGRGEMLQSDVSDQAAGRASELLELVVKLNAVGHERLASLRHKESARMVRELADALTRHQDIQNRLFELSRPIFLDLLNRYRVLIGQHRHGETAELLESLHQLVRLTRNPAMEANVSLIEAVHRYLEGDFARQRELHMSSLAAYLKAGRIRDAQFLRVTYNTCVGLASTGRLDECARLSDAVLLLADGDPPRWQEDWLLLVPRAIRDLAKGNPGRALGQLNSIMAALESDLARNLSDSLLYAGYLSGMTAFPAVVGGWSRMAVGSPPLLLAAFWEADAKDALRTVMRSRRNLEGEPDERSRRLMAALEWTLDGRAPEIVDVGEPVHALEIAVIACEGALRAGDDRAARARFKLAAGMMDKLEPALTPDFLVRALHARQSLALGTAKQKEAAQRFIEESRRQGYGLLRTMEESHPS